MTLTSRIEWQDTFRRWLKFNLVGALGIVVQLGMLYFFTRLWNVDYSVATVLAVESAVLHNFIWHERFTWADRSSLAAGSMLGRLLRFNLTTGAVSIAGNLVLMSVLVGLAHLQVLVANLVTIAICSLANFAVSDRFVFGGGAMSKRENPIAAFEPSIKDGIVRCKRPVGTLPALKS